MWFSQCLEPSAIGQRICQDQNILAFSSAFFIYSISFIHLGNSNSLCVYPAVNHLFIS